MNGFLMGFFGEVRLGDLGLTTRDVFSRGTLGEVWIWTLVWTLVDVEGKVWHPLF